MDQVLALDAAGVDVVPRLLPFDGTRAEVPERVRELACGRGGGFDAVIQCVLPSAYDYDARLGRHVGYYFVETSRFDSSDWPRHINLMDEAWVSCDHNRDASIESGVTVPVRAVPVPCDVTRFERSYAPHPIRDELPDSFLFYFIGDASVRKNLPALITAFHLEFHRDEPVELVLKASIRGLGADESRRRLREEFARVKASLNLYADPSLYKDELIVSERLSDEGVMRLHASCDCFVSASHGEGWGLPAFAAMAMGKTPILPDYSANPSYSNGWLVPGRMEPVTRMQDAHGDLYTARQEWFSVDVSALRAAMRAAYEDVEQRTQRATAGMLRAYDFSYERVGGTMRRMIETLCK